MRLTRVEKAQKYIPCRYCGAKPEEPCRTKSGASYSGKWYVHDLRLQPFDEEWNSGYRVGYASAKRARKKVS